MPAPPQPEDTVPDTVITPPISPFKETASVGDSVLSPEIDIHRLNIPTVLYLEAPPAKESTPPVSPILNAEIPTTPILDLEPEDQNLVTETPESPSVTQTMVLSEDDETLSNSRDSAPASAQLMLQFLARRHCLNLMKKMLQFHGRRPLEELNGQRSGMNLISFPAQLF